MALHLGDGDPVRIPRANVWIHLDVTRRSAGLGDLVVELRLPAVELCVTDLNPLRLPERTCADSADADPAGDVTRANPR
jgi:hypothetical protein